MATRRVGVWLVGAKGGVATTMMTGLAALRAGAIDPVGLVTETGPFTQLGLARFDELVVGGHDIRAGKLGMEARRMWSDSRAIAPDLIDAAAGFFAEVEPRLRPGTLVASGDRIRSLADPAAAALVETPREAVARIRRDLEEFTSAERIDQLVVVNLASTEPPPPLPIPREFAEVDPLLDDPARCPLPSPR